VVSGFRKELEHPFFVFFSFLFFIIFYIFFYGGLNAHHKHWWWLFVLGDTSLSGKFSLSTFGLDLLSSEFLPYMEESCKCAFFVGDFFCLSG
jgi:hypothetical protein